MRIVFDTNVFVSAALKDRSTPAAAVRIAESEHTLLKSTETERQLFDVLARPRFASLIPEAAARRFRSLIARAEIVTINERISVCRDPTDDKFLELAVDGSADLIVSGDSDLLILDPFRQIGIVTPARFVRLITS
jgi:putative PIN family toxin of toxin-antitoxin system